MNRFLSKLLIFVVFILNTFYIFCQEVIINAESILYDKDNNKLIAEENVKVKYKDTTLETQSLIYDVSENVIYTSTDTTIISPDGKLFVKSLEYNINSEQLTIKNFYAYYEPWYSYSDSCNMEKEKLLLYNAKVTHCNKKDPHYYFKSKKVIIYPEKKIKLYSPTLVIRKIPVLWSPYYEVSLKPKKDYVLVEPSYENERGIIAKIKYSRKISDTSELKFLCDSYGRESLGLGGMFTYFSSGYSGVLYIYYINQFKNKSTRWNFRFEDTHKLPFNFSIESKLELLSDQLLYYQYEKENWFLLKSNIDSFVSLSRDTQKTTVRLTYKRNDKYDEIKQKFVNDSYQIPFEFIVYPFSLWKFKISERVSILPSFIESTTHYNLIATNNFNTNLPINLFYFASITPSFDIQTNYNISSSTHIPTYYNIYGFSLPLRLTPWKYLNFDFSYNYRIKTTEEDFVIIFSSNNIISNSISSRADFFYKRSFFRVATMYNFLSQNTTWWYYNLAPLNIQVGISYKNFDFSANSNYIVADKSITNLQISFGYSFLNYNQINITYGRNYSLQDVHYISPLFSIYIPDNIQLRIRSSINFSKELNKTTYKTDLVNTDFEIYKDLHCWEAKFFCNVRKSLSTTISQSQYIFECGGYLGLKFKPYVGKGKPSEVDKLYFPWKE